MFSDYFVLGSHTTPVASLALHLLSLLYVSQPVQHQAEQQTQQQRRPHQQQAQGRLVDLEDSRSRDGMEGRSGMGGQEPDSSRQRGESSRQSDNSDRPDGGSSRHRDGSSERGAGRKRDSRDRELQASTENPRSQRSERGLNGGDETRNQSSHGGGGRWEGEEEGGRATRDFEQGTEGGQAPADFDLRATLNAAKRLKLAQAEGAGKQR